MDISNWINLSSAIILLVTVIFVSKQLSAMREQNKQTAYRDAMDQLLNIKQAVLDNESMINDVFKGDTFFEKAVPDILKGKEQYFLVITIFYYRGEQIWTLRKQSKLCDDDWESVSTLMKQYLSIKAYRAVFYEYIWKAEIHKKGFREDIVKLIGNSEDEFQRRSDKYQTMPFPDPLNHC